MKVSALALAIFASLLLGSCSATPARCPRCGSSDVVPIVYGLPADGACKSARDGKVVLGGCVISDHNPNWFCKRCGYAGHTSFAVRLAAGLASGVAEAMEHWPGSAPDSDQTAVPSLARSLEEPVPDEAFDAAMREAARDPSKRYIPMYVVFCK